MAAIRVTRTILESRWSVRQIAKYPLWLGNVADGRNRAMLLELGIATVVDLAMNEPLAVLPRELVYLRFPIVDGAGNAPWLLRAAADAVASLMRAGVVTLVYCGAGMSRTPAIAAAGLAKAFQMPLDDALISVCDGAPADISSALWAEVRSTVNGAGD